MLKVYCDANIFIDYFDRRTDKLRPLDELAWAFFSKGWNCHFHLVASDWLLKELRRHLDDSQINEVLDAFREEGKLVFVKETKADFEKAKELSSHWQDALHAVLAGKAGADYLATRNLKDYGEFQHLVTVVFPEAV